MENIRNYLDTEKLAEMRFSVGSKIVLGTVLSAVAGVSSNSHLKATVEYGGSKIIIDTSDENEPKSLEINVDNSKGVSLKLDDFTNVVGIGKLTVNSKKPDQWIDIIGQWKDQLYHLSMINEGDNSAAISVADYFEKEPKKNHPSKLLSIEMSTSQASGDSENILKGLMLSLTQNVPATVVNISFKQPNDSDIFAEQFSKEKLCPNGWTGFVDKCSIGCVREKEYLETLLTRVTLQEEEPL